jgi:hypothetical protein
MKPVILSPSPRTSPAAEVEVPSLKASAARTWRGGWRGRPRGRGAWRETGGSRRLAAGIGLPCRGRVGLVRPGARARAHDARLQPACCREGLRLCGRRALRTVVPGIPTRRNLAGHLDGLRHVPRPADHAYHWPTVANTALAVILRLLFPTTSDTNVAAINALENGFAVPAGEMLPGGIYRRSVLRGAQVARHIFAWSKSDGGHEAFLRNFPPYTLRPVPACGCRPRPASFLRSNRSGAKTVPR